MKQDIRAELKKKHRKNLFALHYSIETVWENFVDGLNESRYQS